MPIDILVSHINIKVYMKYIKERMAEQYKTLSEVLTKYLSEYNIHVCELPMFEDELCKKWLARCKSYRVGGGKLKTKIEEKFSIVTGETTIRKVPALPEEFVVEFIDNNIGYAVRKITARLESYVEKFGGISTENDGEIADADYDDFETLWQSTTELVV